MSAWFLGSELSTALLLCYVCIAMDASLLVELFYLYNLLK